MGKRLVKYIIASIICLTCFSVRSSAQFKEEAFSQSYNNDTTAVADSADQLFSFKELFDGLSHKKDMRIGTMFIGSAILPGSAQIYNKDYWKLPVVYGGIGALAGTGGYYLHQYNKTKKVHDKYLEFKEHYESLHGIEYPYEAPPLDLKSKQTGTWLMAGAGLVYWASLLDGVVNYHPDEQPHPGRAALYSALLPGLGQIYNGELFKAPIYWGCLMGSVYFLSSNNINYQRFKRIHNEATSSDPAISGEVPIDAETAKWYRDVYRRYRDYSIVATALFYVLQIIDANVFAYMHDFEVTDDISMDIEPAVISPYNEYAMNTGTSYNMGQNAVGLRLGFNF
jgi:hypothetical protein